MTEDVPTGRQYVMVDCDREAEIKRELRESVVGRAILQRNRELKRRQRRRR